VHGELKTIVRAIILCGTRHPKKGADMKTAVASHILVSSEAECNELKKTIELGVNFAKVAKEHFQMPVREKRWQSRKLRPGRYGA